MRQIILDTETTGLSVKDGHRIIEVAAVELINRKLTGRHYHQYIRPMREIDAGAFQVHGISEEFLADKPLFDQIADELLVFIKDAELIIHNATFDVGFLDGEFQRTVPDFSIRQYCTVTDTLALARKKHPGVPNNLDALCKRYSIDNSNRELHGALLDSHLLAKVYLAMTGGQSTLFNESSVKNHQEKTNILQDAVVQKTDGLVLNIIFANTDELNSHNAQLEKIKENNGGQLLWAETL